MNDMTIRQIAELCDVDESTIYRWIQKSTSAECKSAIAKCKSAREESKPARFTLPETLSIIRAGNRSTLADLLQENAAKAEPQSTALVARDLIKEMIPAMTAAIATAITTAMRQPTGQPQFRQPTLALPAASLNGEYYTIKGYGSMHGVNVNNTNAVMLGREASRISRQKNTDIHKAPDERWGEVNSYHISVLKEVFTV